jgi:hypothetical protein
MEIVHKEVEEDYSQRLQELNNLLKSSRERHSNTLELKDAEISKLKEINQVIKKTIYFQLEKETST